MENQTLWQKTAHLRYRLGRVTRGYNLQPASKAGQENGIPPLKPTSAQALVEFIYVSIPMLMMFLGIFEFGVAFWNNGRLETATREIARRTGICGNGCDTNKDYNVSVEKTPDAYGLAGLWTVSNPPIPVDDKATIDPKQYYFIDPSRINYIYIQRVSTTGKIDLLPTEEAEKPIVARGQSPLPDYKQLFVIYRYDAGANAAAPFKLDNSATATSPVNGATQLNNRGYPSQGYVLGTTRYIGRSMCEPTHRLFVEVQWRHNWISPVQFLPMGNVPINLTSRRAVKVEPRQYQLTTACSDE
jgi:TadE-like protein